MQEFAELCGSSASPSSAVAGRHALPRRQDQCETLAEKADGRRHHRAARPVQIAPRRVGPRGCIGYPLMVQATAGGGGRGYAGPRPAAFIEAFESAPRRGVEVAWRWHRVSGAAATGLSPHRGPGDRRPLRGDLAGGVRSCTFGHARQKVMEESASCLAPRGTRNRGGGGPPMRAGRLTNAGTVEFLYDPV